MPPFPREAGGCRGLPPAPGAGAPVSGSGANFGGGRGPASTKLPGTAGQAAPQGTRRGGPGPAAALPRRIPRHPEARLARLLVPRPARLPRPQPLRSPRAERPDPLSPSALPRLRPACDRLPPSPSPPNQQRNTTFCEKKTNFSDVTHLWCSGSWAGLAGPEGRRGGRGGSHTAPRRTDTQPAP